MPQFNPPAFTFRIALAAAAVLSIAVHSRGSETPVAASPRITVAQLLAAHCECLQAELRSAETQHQVVEQRTASIRELHKAGHASWMEQSHAESECHQSKARVEAMATMLEWLNTEHRLAATQPHSISQVSLLIRLPESRIPVGWLTYSSAMSQSTRAALTSEFHARVSAEELAKAALQVDRATQRLGRLQQSSTSYEPELSLARHQLEVALAEQQTLASNARLNEVQQTCINQIASDQTTHPSFPSASEHESVNSTLSVTQSIVQLVAEENSASPIRELQVINEWLRSTSAATQKLRNQGLASIRELGFKRNQTNGLGHSLMFQEELHNWKQQWTASRLKDPGLPPAPEIPPNPSPARPRLAVITDLSILEFAIQNQREYFQLKADSEAMRHRISQCQMLLDQLQGQARPNPAELEQTQNLLALQEAQWRSLTEQTAISSAIIERVPQLSAAANLGSNVVLLDLPTIEVLIRVASHEHDKADPRPLDAPQRSAERRILAVKALREKGFASSEEMHAAELNLLNIKAERSTAQDSQDRHRHRQSLLVDLQKKFGKAP